jgi:glycosyltransferase involved in cell wall biosynthesis
LVDDLIVVNNGSTDNTAEIAKCAGANVFSEFRQGYGYACLRGIEQLEREGLHAPSVVVFVDGDHSVDVNQLVLLLQSIAEGNDLVVGSRARCLQESQSMGPHQQFGNDLASSLIALLWNQPVTDLGPFRAIRYAALQQLNMQDQGFGWTAEMQIKVIQAGLSYKEVPVSSLRRIGVSKISGTVRGTIGAGIGIFSMVFKLYWSDAKFFASLKSILE